jgi:hypothetical protein
LSNIPYEKLLILDFWKSYIYDYVLDSVGTNQFYHNEAYCFEVGGTNRYLICEDNIKVPKKIFSFILFKV